MHRLPVPVLVLGLVLVLGVAAAAPGDAASGRAYALLVGIGDYDEWNDLANPVPDVRALAHELQHGYGFLVEVLESPDAQELLGALRRYLTLDYGSGDQLVVVFAGHGSYDEVTRVGYLAAADSAVRSRDPVFASLVSYPLLLTLLDNLDVPEVLLVVDACYSGSLGANPVANGTPTTSVRRYLTSGGSEYVPDGRPGYHTPFVTALLDGLRSLDRPGGTLSVELLQSAFMSRVRPSPRWGIFGRGSATRDFVFTRRGPRVAAPAVSAASAAPLAAAPPPSPPPAPAEPLLRSRPARVVEHELERAFRRKQLYDASWNVEGDFPNELRPQSRDLWEVVVDLESGLVWQQAGSPYRLTRAQADGYVAELNAERHAGYGDWRLPTLEELGSLVEPMRMTADLYLPPAFDPELDACWSADVDQASGDPYYVSFNAGRAVLAYGQRTAFVRAVRTQ